MERIRDFGEDEDGGGEEGDVISGGGSGLTDSRMSFLPGIEGLEKYLNGTHI